MGYSYKANKDLESALRYYTKALDFYTVGGSIDYIILGDAWLAKEDYEKATTYYEQALKIVTEYSYREVDNHNIVLIHDNLSYVWRRRGDFDKAISYQNKAIGLSKKHFDKNHWWIATGHRNLGYIYSEQGLYDKAIESFTIALNINIAYHGERLTDVAISYYDLGYAWLYKKNKTKAFSHFRKALETLKNIKKIDRNGKLKKSKLMSVWDHIQAGEHWLFRNRYRDAVRQYEMALKKSANDVSTGASFHYLADAYLAQGNRRKAAEYYTKAWPIVLKFLGANYHYHQSENIFSVSSKEEEGLIDSLEKAINKEAPAVAYEDLGSLLVDKEDYGTATKYFEKALALRLKVKHPESFGAGVTYLKIGNMFLDQKDYEQALIHYNKAEEVYSQQKMDTFLGEVYLQLANVWGAKKIITKVRSI